MLLEFRDYFAFNPGMYLDVSADQPEWDHSLEFPNMDVLLDQWKSPEQADQNYQMEQQLLMVKDIMLDGLDKIIKRGEAMEELQKKTVAIQSASGSIKKKAKKINN